METCQKYRDLIPRYMPSLSSSRDPEPCPSTTLAEKAFNLLRADILAAKLRPGDKMHVERLREIYGLGATPLREALSKLTSLELVTAVGQRGFCVAPVSTANLLDVTKSRAWMEAIALRASVAAGDRHWEAEVLAAAHRLKHCPKNDGERLSEEWYRENREFHDALAAKCGSPQIMSFRSQLYDLSDRYRRMSVQHGLAGRDFDAEHQRIVDAALTRDADSAIAHTIDHFVETTRVILLADPQTRPDAGPIIATLRRDIAVGCSATTKQNGVPHLDQRR
jgi:GntR family transcriptional regulator, carbon starvation induced regulator